jgi:superfamily II DNA or RNA helicase
MLSPERPSIGQIVRVRTRQYLVEDVVPPPVPGEDTLVRLSCVDDDARGDAIEVLWEHEVDGEVLDGARTMRIADRGFDRPSVFSAYLHTLRWNCVTSTDPKLLQAPYRAGIEVMAYQLEPLRKALLLPRVNLFIADDVGLGKTIEAGLILRELILRQKVRRVVAAVPPSVVLQWRDELEQRFGLTFVVFDRDFVLKKRRERGFSVNPFTTHSRFIISHALLRDEAHASLLRDWIEDDDDQKPEHREPALLILDEAHNAAPASAARYAIDSKLTKTVRELAPLFEHRLFLSATPHNGHSNSFSALLEILDPQRFCRGVKPSKQNVNAVMVRRLKEDLRGLGLPGFPKRDVVQIDIPSADDPPLPDSAPELELSRLLDEYRELRESKLEAASKSAKSAAKLVVISLQKRLLSSIEAFACTLAAHRRGLDKKAQKARGEVDPADLEAPGADDERSDVPEEELTEEQEAMLERATETAGATFSELGERERSVLDRMTEVAGAHRAKPDPRIVKLVAWIRENCLEGTSWNDRRLLIFTEYADTKRYLEQRLREALAKTESADERIAVFHGGMDEERREEVKAAFNASPDKHPLRILIATDAAREGVNLQNHCANLFHFDVPWNPSRMEQRNGRIDRKLQRSKIVRCHYFVFTQRPEDNVLKTLIEKTARIQEELGSLAPVLEARLGKILESGIRRKDVHRLEKAIRDESIDSDKRRVADEELDGAARARREDLAKQLEKLRDLMDAARKAIDFDEERFRAALSAGLTLLGTEPLEAESERAGVYRLPSDPKLLRDPTWQDTLDTLRTPKKRGEKLWEWRKSSPLRPVVFKDIGSLDDTKVHLHLEQRVVQRVLGRFLAQGFVRDDLSRGVAVISDGAIPRVVLLGRLSIFGEHGSRLHDAICAIAAQWKDPSRRRGPLEPYAKGREAEREAFLDVEKALALGRDVPEPTRTMLLSGAERDFADLLPHLAELADVEARWAEGELKKRGKSEAEDMVRILDAQKARIQKEMAEPEAEAQLALFGDEELKQFRLNLEYWKKRVQQIDRDLVDEPERISATYATRARRIEPVGLVYLWPVSG